MHMHGLKSMLASSHGQNTDLDPSFLHLSTQLVSNHSTLALHLNWLTDYLTQFGLVVRVVVQPVCDDSTQ